MIEAAISLVVIGVLVLGWPRSSRWRTRVLYIIVVVVGGGGLYLWGGNPAYQQQYNAAADYYVGLAIPQLTRADGDTILGLKLLTTANRYAPNHGGVLYANGLVLMEHEFAAAHDYWEQALPTLTPDDPWYNLIRQGLAATADK